MGAGGGVCRSGGGGRGAIVSVSRYDPELAKSRLTPVHVVFAAGAGIGAGRRVGGKGRGVTVSVPRPDLCLMPHLPPGVVTGGMYSGGGEGGSDGGSTVCSGAVLKLRVGPVKVILIDHVVTRP